MDNDQLTREFYRWQGIVDTTLSAHGKRVDELRGDIQGIYERLDKLPKNNPHNHSKLRHPAALGAAAGGGTLAVVELVRLLLEKLMQ